MRFIFIMFMEDVSGFERCDRLDTALYIKHAFTFPERGMSTEYYMFLEELLSRMEDTL